MNNAIQIYNAAMQLPEDERTALIARLLGSIDGEADADADEAWREEINRRLAELDSGAVTPIPWSQAREMILGNLNGPTAD
jgi:putative addiction module component (TIGR02574 family)